MSEQVTIKIAESANLVVDITDKMVADYLECRRLAAERDCDGKDCRSCSLDTSADFAFSLCELPVVTEAIEGRDSREHPKV